MAARTGYHFCTCIGIDVESYGRRNDRAQSEVQHDLERIISTVSRRAGFDMARWEVRKNGDEQLFVIPHDESEPRLVDDWVRHLAAELAVHNGVRLPEASLRLRVAVHHGLIEVRDEGLAGAAVVQTVRLRDSDAARDALRAAPDVDLVLVVSDDIYERQVVAGHTALRPDAFLPLPVSVKEYEGRGWLHLPGGGGRRQGAGDRPSGGGGGGERATVPGQQVVNTFHGAVDLRGGVVGFGGGGHG